MKDPIILLDKQIIQNQLIHQNITLHLFDTIDSTNQYLKSFLKTEQMHLCCAEQQTQGKGRLGRNWFSPHAQNIYFSFLYFFNKNINSLPGLSLVVSLAIAKVLSTFINQPFLVKWPNDVFYQDKKISGTLIESFALSPNKSAVIIGVGINVNMTDAENEINQPWTSLQKITGHIYNRNEIIISLVNHLLLVLENFAEKGLIYFINEWKECDYLKNQFITIKHLNETLSGYAMGIDKEGQLLLQDENGIIKAISSGEIH